MRKKIILGLSVLIVFLTVLWSCHNEDFAKGEAEPQRNNANFFKHAQKGGINAKSGVDYISILEAYNREKDFLTTMDDQKGMPIWDKMQVLDIGEKTVLYIPLSADETELSSLLIVKVDENNSVFHVQDFTNDYLKTYVYNANYPKENRRLLMDTFLQMDFFTFGHQEFTNLPKDLYEGSTEYNRLNIMDAKKGTEQNKMFIYTTVCTTFHYCVHGQSASTCDYANCNCGGFIHCFLVTSCSTTATWIDDDPFPSGGGGGGGGTPGPQPPKDPCSLNTVFYRLAPGCGTGTGNVEVPELDDPCAKAKPSIDKANDILHSQAGQNMTTNLNVKIGATKEWAVAIGKTSNNEYETTPAVEQNVSNGNSPVGLLSPGSTLIGDGHSHRDNPGNPSAGDLYHMLNELFSTQNNHIPNPNFLYRFVYGNTNGVKEIYALVINDLTLAQEFLQQYPMDENYDEDTHSFLKDSKLGRDIEEMKSIYNNKSTAIDTSGETYDPRSVGLAYIFDKFNAGISISKVDANGNLRKINASREKIPNINDERAKISKCPN